MRRRRMAPFVAAALVLFACSSDASTSGPGASSAQAPGVDTTTSIVVGSDGSSTVVVAPDETSTTATDGAVPRTGTGPTTIEIDPSGPPGSFAPAILRPVTTGVDLDVRSQSDAAPRQGTIDHVVSVLGDVSGKTVTDVGGSTIDGGARDWSADDLRALAGNTGQGNGHAVLHLLFVHGTFGGDTSILGASIRGDTAAIFVDRVDAAATPLVGSAGIEVSVVTHEVGHLLGLVDLYLHTGRQDPEHPGHSTNKGSVMYWAVESDLVAELLQGGPPRDFDRADLADLSAIRNGG